MIRATFVYVFIGAYILIFAPVGMVWVFLSGNPHALFALARPCVIAAGCICGVRVRIRGAEKVRRDRNYIFLGNHQGNFDAPALFYAMHRDFLVVMKKEMMRFPVLSLAFRQLGFIPVDRSNPATAHRAVDMAADRAREGRSFMAFPEGTRSRDGRLQEFKKGVFIMALKSGVPIVPVTIRNSSAIQARGEYVIRPGVIEVIFHDPVSTENLTLDDRDRLIAMTRAAIESEL